MNSLKRFARREPSAIAAFVILTIVAVGWMLNTPRLSISAIAIVIAQTLPLAMVACGMAVIIFGKGIDLSLGMILTITNVIIAYLSSNGMPVLLAALIALVVSLLVGSVNGVLVAYMGLPPLVITLATSSILAGVALYILPTPGGSVPRWFSQLVLMGLRILPKPSSLRRSCVRFRFSRPQRTCSGVMYLPLPYFSWAVRMASTCSMAITMPRVCAMAPSSRTSLAVPWPLS